MPQLVHRFRVSPLILGALLRSKLTIDWAEVVVWAMAAVYAAFFSMYTILKHNSFMTYMCDLGICINSIWKLIHEGDPRPPFGASHQSQLIYVIALLYSFFPRPEVLLVIQSIVVPLGAIPLYRLAKRELNGKVAPLAITAAYLLYPPLHGLSQYDFHLEAFLPPLFIASAYFFKSGTWIAYMVTLTLTLMTMEYASYLVFMFGLWLLLSYSRIEVRRRRVSIRSTSTKALKMGLLTVSISVLLIILHIAYGGMTYTPVTVLTSVTEVQPHPTVKEKIEYLTKLYGPLSFLPLISISQIMTLPWFIFAFTSPASEHIQIYNHYSAHVAPFIFIGVVDVLKTFKTNRSLLTLFSGLILTTTLLYAAYTDPVFTNPYPPHTPHWPSVTTKDQILSEIIGTIPPNAPVLTQNNIAPHLAYRREIYITSTDITIEPEYILIDRSHFSYDEPNLRPSPAQTLPELLKKGTYGLKVRCGTIELYEKGYKGETLELQGC